MQCNIDRTDEQRRRALDIANEVRTYRAQLKLDLKAGRVLLDDVLDADDPLLASMRIYDLLVAVPWLGQARVRTALRDAHISHTRRLGALTVRERRDLYAKLCATPLGARAVYGPPRGRTVRSGRRAMETA
jgi:hypothetical protein